MAVFELVYEGLRDPAVLMIVWPGHTVPATPYHTMAQCEETLDLLRRAGHDLFETVPGFHHAL